METRKIICKSGNEYNIINEYWKTSYAWGHKSTLLKNDYKIDTNKVRYQNRTWECYTYQSCMRGLISSIFHDNFINYVANYKKQHGIARFKKGQRTEVRKEFEKEVYIQDLMEIMERINNRDFD